MTELPELGAVLGDWIRQGQEGRRFRRDVRVRALAIPPAVVAPADAEGLVVDLFPGVLADVANHDRARAPARDLVDREPERVPQAERPNLREKARVADERVVRGNDVTPGVAVRNVDVYPEHLAEQHGGVLRAMVRIVGAAAIAERNVEVAVRSEREVAGIVVGEWLPDGRVAARPLQIVPRGGIGAQRVRVGSAVARDDGVAIRACACS